MHPQPHPRAPSMRMLWLEPGSDEWHAHRAPRLTGSTAANALGEGAWGTPLGEWARIRGQAAAEVVDNPYAEWGLATEAAHRAWIAHDEKLDVESVPGIAVHPEIDWLCYSPDGLASEPSGSHPMLLELKAPSVYTRDEWGTKLPRFYQIQLQIGMQVTGLEWGLMSALLPPRKDPWGAFVRLASMALSEGGGSVGSWEALQRLGFERVSYPLERDERLGEALLGALRRFWRDYVEARVQPPATGASRDKRLLGSLATGEADLDFDEEAVEMATSLDAANEELKVVKERKEALQNRLTQKAGAATWMEAKKLINQARKEVGA